PLPGLGYGKPVEGYDFTRLANGRRTKGLVQVAEEIPVAFVYGSRAHVVMMCTPTDLEDLAYGFTLSEEIVKEPGEILGVESSSHSRGIELKIDVAADVVERLGDRSRALAGRTGCGL